MIFYLDKMDGARIYVLIFFLSVMVSCQRESAELQLKDESKTPVFEAGQDGYACFRIPAIVQAKDGSLLAFAEGRKQGCSDTGDIDLLLRRSQDGGRTWSSLQIVWDDEGNTCGNPAPVMDQNTGFIHLLSTWNHGEDREREIIEETSMDTRRVYHLFSEDNGQTWSQPREVTGSTKMAYWTWYATGPGSGIQLEHGEFAGRLMIACDHIVAGSKNYHSHVIYSDNGGRSWLRGGISPQDQVNECEVAEMRGGQLVLNMRNYDRSQKYRQVAYSNDGGMTWSYQQHDTSLVEPICQASLQSFHVGESQYLLFSNPADSSERKGMTIRWSADQGESWDTKTLLLHEGPSAYSDLVQINESTGGCLFERGGVNPYEQIAFSRFSL
ncbi:MAG: glycoside hydrolase [Saprospiraceae bacterium]|nr:glycoside hydrolase [Saprospiraceae bacterium]